MVVAFSYVYSSSIRLALSRDDPQILTSLSDTKFLCHYLHSFLFANFQSEDWIFVSSWFSELLD